MITQANRWSRTFVLSIALHETHEAVPLQAAPHHVPRLDSVRLSVQKLGLRNREQLPSRWRRCVPIAKRIAILLHSVSKSVEWRIGSGPEAQYVEPRVTSLLPRRHQKVHAAIKERYDRRAGCAAGGGGGGGGTCTSTVSSMPSGSTMYRPVISPRSSDASNTDGSPKTKVAVPLLPFLGACQLHLRH